MVVIVALTVFVFAVSDLEWSTGPLCRSDKRHIVCAEMLETEQNYLCALNAIVKVLSKCNYSCFLCHPSQSAYF